jgi:hypothetical protein
MLHSVKLAVRNMGVASFPRKGGTIFPDLLVVGHSMAVTAGFSYSDHPK